MSTITTTADGLETGAPATHLPLALRLRRWALVAMPVLAGVLAVVGALADPAPGETGQRLNEAYTLGMGPLQVKSLSLHWAYAFWIAPAVLVVRHVVGRGRALANVAGVVGFAGMTTLPGLLFIDWVDSAVGQLWGPAAIDQMHGLVEEQAWAFPIMQLPGIIGLFLALPLAVLALWRARLARWWAPLAAVLAVAAFMVGNATWLGGVGATLGLTVVAVALERATREGTVS
jgi:hypothetical protein